MKNKDTAEAVYRHVKRNGPTQSASLSTRKKGSNGWWEWKAEKRALEYLFTVGRLMVAYREGLQTAAAKLDISGQFYCGLYIDQ